MFSVHEGHVHTMLESSVHEGHVSQGAYNARESQLFHLGYRACVRACARTGPKEFTYKSL